MDIVRSKISIIESVEASTSLDCVTIGQGAPKTFLLSGVHGNEKTGQIIIKKLLEALPSFSGTLTILPIANPTGFSNDMRQESLSGLDLNRNFFYSDDENPANKIVQAITTLAKQHDYVIDLHNFSTAGLIQVVSNHIGSSDALAISLRPDVVRTSGKDQALRKTGTLNQYLKDAGIPYILLEMPVHQKVTDEQIDRIVLGLIAHLENPGQYANLPEHVFDKIPKVGIRLVKAEVAGSFVKSAELTLGGTISTEDVIGEILADGTRHPIRSPYEGIICEMDAEAKRSVTIGDTIIGIGETQ